MKPRFVRRHAWIGMLDISVSAVDPALIGSIIEFSGAIGFAERMTTGQQHAQIELLKLALDWQGAVPDQGKLPLVSGGQFVRRLQWVDTPPMYVSGKLDSDNVVTVTFTEDVKATDYTAGVRLLVNGTPVRVLRAFRQRLTNTVSYVIRSHVRRGDAVTWAYDAVPGSVENWGGERLFSVSEKMITSF